MFSHSLLPVRKLLCISIRDLWKLFYRGAGDILCFTNTTVVSNSNLINYVAYIHYSLDFCIQNNMSDRHIYYNLLQCVFHTVSTVKTLCQFVITPKISKIYNCMNDIKMQLVAWSYTSHLFQRLVAALRVSNLLLYRIGNIEY